MELAIFIITALIALVGAGAMIMSRNAVHSALFLLLNFAAIAILYLLLRAPFLFAVQLIVYTGAIMVLFLFVVMLLGAERAEDERDAIAWQKPLAIGLSVILFIEALIVSFRNGFAALPELSAEAEQIGAPETIGQVLFSKYLLPFEITSIILLVAIIGVIVLNQRRKTVS
jgi:NADH:ubiquinone oxidoreductase subunit 6 (chain J)